MKKLNKNFYEQKRTVEAMTGSCSYYGCDCAAGDCVCSSLGQAQYNTFRNNWTNYLNGFRNAAF